MFGMGRKTIGYLAIGGAVAGMAMLLNTKKGKEIGSKIVDGGGELLNGAMSGLGSITDKAMNIMPWSSNDGGSKTKESVIMDRNENNSHLHRGESISGAGSDMNMKRGDSAMNYNPVDLDTGANIRRGDSMEEMDKDTWKL